MKIDQSGFSLVELLVALAVLALVVSIAPVFTGPSRSAVAERAFASKLLIGLKVARSSAVRRNRPALVTFDARLRRFEFAGEQGSVLLPKDISATLRAARSADPESRMKIAFFPDGSSSGGTISLVSPRATTVIEVDWLSGRVQFKN